MSGLGKGLGSLIPAKATPKSSNVPASTSVQQTDIGTQVVELPVDRISPNPMQPRSHFDDQAIADLAESIDQYGLLEPIIVTQVGTDWELVAGERRLRAHKRLKRKTILALIRTASELEKLELAIIENLQREDLNPIEAAQSMRRLVDDFGLTQSEAAKKMGLARSSLTNMLRLLELPESIQLGLAQKAISVGHAKVLLGLDSAAAQQAAYDQLVAGHGSSVSEFSVSVRSKKRSRQKSRSAGRVYQRVEDRLQSALGTKVAIRPKQNHIKQIVIETYSDDEFSAVVKKLSESQ